MKCLLMVVLVMFNWFSLMGQSSDLLDEAKSLERQYKTLQAIAVYQQYRQLHPSEMQCTIRIAELYVMYSDEVQATSEKKIWLDSAAHAVQYAFQLDSLHADCFYAKALVTGKLIDYVSLKEKVASTKSIKNDADKALLIDPQHLKAAHLLGRWNMEVSSLNPAAKTAMKLVFGGLPPASMDVAIEIFQRVRKRSPSFLANNLDLALALKKTGKPREAIELLEYQLKLPTKTAEDVLIKKQSKALLESFQ